MCLGPLYRGPYWSLSTTLQIADFHHLFSPCHSLGPSSLDPPYLSLEGEAEGKFCKSWKGGDFLFWGWWTSSLCFTSPTPTLALPTLLLAGLDRQTMDLGPSAPVGSRKLHRACSGCLCLPFILYVSGCRTGYCTHSTLKQAPGDLEGGWCCPYCSLGGLYPGSQVH